MIGAMSLVSTLRALARCRLAAALVVVAASLGTGCDAEPETTPAAGGSAELGRSASELDEAEDEAADDESSDEAPPADAEVVGPPGGSSPLDPRAEPDPIPWVPRSDAHDT